MTAMVKVSSMAMVAVAMKVTSMAKMIAKAKGSVKATAAVMGNGSNE